MNESGYVETSTYAPIPQGNYDAVIQGVINIGLRPQVWKGETKPSQVMYKVIFELPDYKREDDETGLISKKFKLSVSSRSAWFKFMRTILGDEVTEKTLNMYPINNLLGKSCIVEIDHWEKDEGSAIPVVKEISRLDPRLPQPKPTRELFLFNPRNPDLDVFKNLITFRTQQEIMEAQDSQQFSKELHKLWVKIQEEKAKEQEKDSPKGNTAAIE